MSLKARWITIAIILVGAFVSIYPNLVDLDHQVEETTVSESGESITETVTKSKHWWPTKSKINYGLDIQGGLHLVLGVDVDEVIVEKTKRLARSVSSDLVEKQLGHVTATIDPNNKLHMNFNLSQAGDTSKVSQFITKNYPSTLQIIDEQPGKTVVQYYQTKADEYKKQVVDQAIEVIRNRIDQTGTKEPSITAQGLSLIHI